MTGEPTNDDAGHVHVASGATPLTPIVACPTSGNARIINDVARLLVVSPAVVSVAVTVAVTVLAGLGRVTASDAVSVYGGVLATHTAAVSVQSLKRSA